ncbi:hypothetical protein PF011_g29528 [Phytophthora fragariae]|uniref:Uncharacterized protein n=1 Tax=Phytophthora fragariae TaxID=53985 RepID=A0A6A3GY16_9STRA|nr:hypothetical protein PF011_g29528 [Phytophthora fragariae]
MLLARIGGGVTLASARSRAQVASSSLCSVVCNTSRSVPREDQGAATPVTARTHQMQHRVRSPRPRIRFNS